jgi:transposase, IS5 family
MLRMYVVQQWYVLADEALEDAVYDSQALRHVIGIAIWAARASRIPRRY